MIRYRTTGFIAIGGLALLSGCKHHRPVSEVAAARSQQMMVGQPVVVEAPVLVSSNTAGIIAGPLPHLLDSGKASKSTERLTAHNHPTGLWPAAGAPSKQPSKSESTEKVVPEPAAKTAVVATPVASPKPIENVEGPKLGPTMTTPKEVPAGTFLASSNEVSPVTKTEIITSPKNTSPVVKLMGMKSTERMGHGLNYRWVAGVLDKHQKGGYWTLRYADYSADDVWGGKVRLIEDPRLANFKNGDVVYLEGELLAPAGASRDSGSYPPYKVSQIQTLDSGR